MEENNNPTDNNLVELFRSIGFDITRDVPDLFFTNFVLGYREKGISGNFKDVWAQQDAPFFYRLENIIKPHIILCLGKNTFIPVLRSLNCEMPKITSYNHFIESDKNPVKVNLADGTPTSIFALAHCGVMGTLNRNRGTKYKRSLDLQKKDWSHILHYL